MLRCELCRADEKSVEIGDYGGSLLCAKCAAKEPDAQNWVKRMDDMGYGNPKQTDTTPVPRSRLLESSSRKSSMTRRVAEGEAPATGGDVDTDAAPSLESFGELAEMIRSWLVKKMEAKPPGLQTITGNGQIVIKNKDALTGAGVSITIAMETAPPPMPPMPAQPEINQGIPTGIGPQAPGPLSPEATGIPPAAPTGPTASRKTRKADPQGLRETSMEHGRLKGWLRGGRGEFRGSPCSYCGRRIGNEVIIAGTGPASKILHPQCHEKIQATQAPQNELTQEDNSADLGQSFNPNRQSSVDPSIPSSILNNPRLRDFIETKLQDAGFEFEDMGNLKGVNPEELDQIYTPMELAKLKALVSSLEQEIKGWDKKSPGAGPTASSELTPDSAQISF
jgi:hypothetical protein